MLPRFRSLLCLFAMLSLARLAYGPAMPADAAAVRAPIIGEIEELVLDPLQTDDWAAGIITVGGQRIIIPRNLIVDLPANRLTLKQLMAQAPAPCGPTQSGLAKADTCLTGGQAAIATVLANRTNGGDLIAGHVHIDKGLETVSGTVTYIDYTKGYFRINGSVLNATQLDDGTGAMVRMNDPVGRFSIQTGPECATDPVTGAVINNCSADPRFTADTDNHTWAFITGFPACIPSTVTNAVRTVGSDTNGIGDPFCPETNRPAQTNPYVGVPVPDSTRFAPIKLGDHITATGNYEKINIVGGSVYFLSAHTGVVNGALITLDNATQPDSVRFDEVIWEAPASTRLSVRG